MKRLLGTLLVVSALAGCSDDPGPEPDPVPSAGPPGTTAPPGLDEVPPGYDESPDGAPPVPDEELDDKALTELLRTRASVTGAGHCGPDQVAVTLEGFDMALGHRFTRVVVRNTSERVCVVEGVPGIGVRGHWGSTFVPEVGHSDRAVDGARVVSKPIRLEPGARATSDLEWTGDLAGAESEHASLLVVQLTADRAPVAVRAVADGGPLDIGQFTTIRLTPWASD